MDEVMAVITEQVADARRLLADVLVGLEQVRNMLEATQAQAMVAIGDATAAWDPMCEQFVPDELGVLLACSTVAGSARYGLACQARDYPILARAWRAGTIDARKVSLIADQLQHLTPEQASEVAGVAVRYAVEHTPAQTRAWLSRRIIATDPQAAEARRERARADRCVVFRPGHDDARGMDQRRADVFVDLLVGRATPPNVELLVLAPVETVTGGDPFGHVARRPAPRRHHDLALTIRAHLRHRTLAVPRPTPRTQARRI